MHSPDEPSVSPSISSSYKINVHCVYKPRGPWHSDAAGGDDGDDIVSDVSICPVSPVAPVSPATPVAPTVTPCTMHSWSHRLSTHESIINQYAISALYSPPNCPFTLDDYHQNIIHPYQARPHSPPQTASRFNQPFRHNPMCGQTDGKTWSITLALCTILIESDALIMCISRTDTVLKLLHSSLTSHRYKLYC